jgi:AcrR family transcriptional regulator
VRADAERNRAAILAAAEVVFAERGPRASTEEVAQRAGVAVGTVFRHFPTKTDLLAAIMKELLSRLSVQVRDLAEHGDPGAGLFELFVAMVEEAAAKKTVVELLAGVGVEVPIAAPVAGFQAELGQLLTGAQRAGAVRADVGIGEISALLVSLCQGAVTGGWPAPLRSRVVAVVIAGLRA